MKGIKKYICMIPLVFVFLISNVLSISSFASFVDDRELVSSFSSQFKYYDSSDFKSQSFIDSSEPYFMIRYYTSLTSSDSIFYSYTFFLKSNGKNCNVTSELGLYDFEFDGTALMYFASYRNEILSDGTVSTGGSASISSWNRYSVDRFTYDTNTNVAVFYNDDSELFRTFSTTFHDFETDITDISAGLDLTVSFSPALSGEVERIYELNGVQYSQKGFTMRVTNNGSKPSQFAMYILKKDDFDNMVSSDMSVSKYAYVYYTKEWVYSSSKDNIVDNMNNVFYRYHKATRWHYISPGETKSQYFDWSQIPIEDNNDYVVLVQGISTDYDIASECFVQMASDGEAYPEYKQLQLELIKDCYTSTFNVTYLGDVQYNYDNNSNGIIPYKDESDFQRAAYSYDAKEEKDGSINYENVNLYDDPDSWVHNPEIIGGGSFSYNFGNKPYASNEFNYGVDGFINNSTSFLSFLQHAFSFMPSWYFNIIAFGLFAIIFMAIIHRL